MKETEGDAAPVEEVNAPAAPAAPKKKAGRPKKEAKEPAPTPLTDAQLHELLAAGTKPAARVKTLASSFTAFGIPEDLHKAARAQWVEFAKNPTPTPAAAAAAGGGAAAAEEEKREQEVEEVHEEEVPVPEVPVPKSKVIRIILDDGTEADIQENSQILKNPDTSAFLGLLPGWNHADLIAPEEKELLEAQELFDNKYAIACEEDVNLIYQVNDDSTVTYIGYTIGDDDVTPENIIHAEGKNPTVNSDGTATAFKNE